LQNKEKTQQAARFAEFFIEDGGLYMFYILQRGLSSEKPVDMSALSEEALNAELEKGYADMKAGRTKPASEVFANIRREQTP
jgi:hypothetical protein